MGYAKKGDHDWPKGWYSVPVGFNNLYRAVWATGNEYRWDGNAPNRAEVIQLDHQHGPFVTYEWITDMEPATPEQISEALKQLEYYYAVEIKSCEDSIATFKRELDNWRLRADLDEWKTQQRDP